MPAFSDSTKYTDEKVELFIEQAYNYISPHKGCLLKCKSRRYAIELMAAHLLTLNDRILSGNMSAGGRITSANIDKISVSLEAPKNQNDWNYWLSLTPYGMALSALLISKAPIGIYSGGINYRSSLK
jgi:hypothetical protein